MSNPTELPDLDMQLDELLVELVSAWSKSSIESTKKRIRELFTRRAKPEGEAPQADLKKRMADALNVTLWLYRRLPGAYGRPPFVDAALLEMAKIADIDAQGSIKERAAQLDGGQEGSAP